MSELLNCPFCGSRAIPHRLVDTAHVIECVECGARGAESGPGHVAKTEREAAALWNRRTPTAREPAGWKVTRIPDPPFPNDLIVVTNEQGDHFEVVRGDQATMWDYFDALSAHHPEVQPAEPIAPIDRDEGYERDYIPLPGGCEVQTKGRGSSFRVVTGIGTPSEQRLNIPDSPYLHETLERMARDIHAATFGAQK